MDSLYGVQPFEELAYNDTEPTSPTSLEDFYKEQERKDLERRLSRKSLRRRKGRSKSFASTTSNSAALNSPDGENPPSLHSPGESGLPPLLENDNTAATPPNGSGHGTPTRTNGTGGNTPELRGGNSFGSPSGHNTPNGAGTGAGGAGGFERRAGGSGGGGDPQQQRMGWYEQQPRRDYFPPESIPKPSYDIHNQTMPQIPWTNHHLRPPGTPWPPTSQPRKVISPQNMANYTSLIHRTSQGGGGTPGSNGASTSSFGNSSSATTLAPPAIYAPDHIDILDPSDPWGMRWHHDSRYDVGDFTSSARGRGNLNNNATWAGTSSPVVDLPTRGGTGRGNSPNGTQQQHRPNVKSPSPLSQSTSAPGPTGFKNHSSISLDTPKQLSRRLSKRGSRTIYSQPPTPAFDGPGGGGGSVGAGEGKRISGFRSFFSSSSSTTSAAPPMFDRQRRVTLGSNSAPPTANGLLTDGKGTLVDRPHSKHLTAPPPSSYSPTRSSLTPSPTKEVGGGGGGANGIGKDGKRSSYLGRLVKKFSIIRHQTESSVGPPGHNNGTPPNSAGLKRSVSTALGGTSGLFQRSRSDLDLGHPKFASAPVDTVESPISQVPELRLVGVEEQERERELVTSPTALDYNGKRPNQQQVPHPNQQQRQQLQTQQRPLSDGRNSPEPQLSIQFSGLVITNPDARASAASTMEGEDPSASASASPRMGGAGIRRVEQNTPPNPNAMHDMMHAPRPAFMRSAGGAVGAAGGASSTESSPVQAYNPLRVVNGHHEQTDTETEMDQRQQQQRAMMRDIPSPRSPTGTVSTIASSRTEPRRSLYSENGGGGVDPSSQSQLMLSAIPSIPDLPNVSPFNPARSLVSVGRKDSYATDSPRSEMMETALETMSPPMSNLSMNSLLKSSTNTREAMNRADSSGASTPASASASARRPSPQQRPSSIMSVTRSPSLKALSISPSIPTSTSSGTTAKQPPTVTPAVSSIRLAPASEYDYDANPPPVARRRAPSSGAATAAAGSDAAGGSRHGAYYSPGTFPALSMPPGTPGTQSQRHSLLSLENNPLPTPPARFPLPLLSESGSRERLRTRSSSERVRPAASTATAALPEKNRERVMSSGSGSRERLASQKSKETIRESTAARAERNEALARAAAVVDLSFSPTFDRPSSRDKRAGTNGSGVSNSREVEVVQERRNQSTFRIPGESSSDSRPSSRDVPSSMGTGATPRERTKSQSREATANANANQSRSRVESGSYDVTLSRPPAIHSNSYHSQSSSLRDSDQDETASMRRKRANSSVGSESQRNGAIASAGSSGREEVRRRTNSTRGASSTASSSRAATVDSVSTANGRHQSSKPESKVREEPKQEDPSKLVIAGLGQNWEVVEAVMIQPHQSSSSSTKKPVPLSKEQTPTVNPPARSTSNGVPYPTRTTSRPGFNAAGEPIAISSGSGASARASSSARRGTTTPTREYTPTSPTREAERSSGVSQRAPERSKTVDDRSLAKPVVPTRSKSRPREVPNVNLNKPQPPRPPPTPVPAQQSLPNGTYEPPRRRDSLQRVRPTSEVANPAELGAHEVWEHDRMTARGQSVLFPDGFSVGPPSSHRASAGSSVLLQNQHQNSMGTPASPGAGSAHTVFKVQPPFRDHRQAPPAGYYYPNHQPMPNPLPAPPVILPSKTTRNRI